MNLNEAAHMLGYCCPKNMMDSLFEVSPALVWEAFAIPPSTFRRWKRQYRRGEFLCKDRLNCRRSKQPANGL